VDFNDINGDNDNNNSNNINNSTMPEAMPKAKKLVQANLVSVCTIPKNTIWKCSVLRKSDPCEFEHMSFELGDWVNFPQWNQTQLCTFINSLGTRSLRKEEKEEGRSINSDMLDFKNFGILFRF
jgi:hypothetical protein